MASNPDLVEKIIDRISDVGAVSAKKMFGEYGVFCDGKMVALICDNVFYVKPTPGGNKLVGDIEMDSPYFGAKPCYVITDKHLENHDWLIELIKITAQELPEPKKLKPRKT